MAKPVNFEKANKIWLGDVEKDIADLPVNQEGDESISCWELSADELAVVQETGRVWLYVLGRQPPVFISGKYPFKEADDDSAGPEDQA